MLIVSACRIYNSRNYKSHLDTNGKIGSLRIYNSRNYKSHLDMGKENYLYPVSTIVEIIKVI